MITDSAGDAAPALVLSKVDSGVPVGPASNLQYTITLKNIGNVAATGVTITDPIPDYTSFVSADSGGTFSKKAVTWSGLGIPAGGSVSVKLTVKAGVVFPALRTLTPRCTVCVVMAPTPCAADVICSMYCAAALLAFCTSLTKLA